MKIIYLIKKCLSLFIMIFISTIYKSIRKKVSKSLLLIRLDGIGDYILFRNFIEDVIYSKKYDGYSIDFIGSNDIKELFEIIDMKYFSKAIWIDMDKILRNLIYTVNVVWKICINKYEFAFNSRYTRIGRYDNLLTFIVNAKEKIGYKLDPCLTTTREKILSRLIYTNQIKPENYDIKFEFYNNKYFFEKVLGKKLNTKLNFIFNNNYNNNYNNISYIIIYIGGRAEKRRWRYYPELIFFLLNKYNYKIFICGGPSDITDSKLIMSKLKYNQNVLNLVGKISWTELIYLAKSAQIIFTNETGFTHLCVALSKQVVIFSNANQLGRFHPYPIEFSQKYYIFYPSEVEKQIYSKKIIPEKLIKKYGYYSNLDVNEIKFDDVKKAIEGIIS